MQEKFSTLVRSHIVDSIFFGDGFSTHPAKQIFSDINRMQRWMDVEVALAEAQAEMDIIPMEAASELKATAKIDRLDLISIKAGIDATKHSLVPLIQAWQKIVSPKTGQYIHFGATTQDIQDTAQVLELKEIIEIIEKDYIEIIQDLSDLANKHRDLIIIGRTHFQHALPMTLGLKIAVWLDDCIRNYDRLQNCKKNLLVSQLFGGVGSMTALSDRGIEVLRRFSSKLGLGCSLTSWHSSRDRFVELLSVMALITGTFGKIANEIIQLNRNEIGELSEPFQKGQIGSSTMPHKRNPENCERVITLARLVKGCASLSYDTLCAEHERDYRAVRTEWITLTDASLYTCCAFEIIKPIIKKLVVNEKRIRENVKRSKQLISSESVMFAIGEKIGKQSAHQIVYECIMRVINDNTDLIDELYKEPIIGKYFDKRELEKILDKPLEIGLSKQLVDNIIKYKTDRFG